jgi:CBS domain-containing protein
MYDALSQLRVSDAMHPGLISCSADTPLRTAARMMATYRVHAILVAEHGAEKLAGSEPWGVVSDTDLLRAAEHGDLDEQECREAVALRPLTIGASEDLARAARLMSEELASHAIVVEPRSGRPIGMLSTHDLARALAGFPEHHPAGQ